MKYGISILVAFVLLFSCCKSEQVNAEETVEVNVLKKDNIPNESEPNIDRVKQDFIKRVKDLDAKAEISQYDVPCTVISYSTYNGSPTDIIRSKEQLKSLKLSDSKLPTDIDFSKYAIVVANAGRFSTGGYTISLKSAILDNNELKLNFFVKSPEPDVAVTMAFTQPCVVVLVEVDPSVKISINIEGASKDSNSRLLDK